MPTDQVIFWDFDGTLAKLENGWSGCMARALAQISPEKNVSREMVKEKIVGKFPWDAPDRAHPLEWKNADEWWRPVETMLARAAEDCGISRERSARAAIRTRELILDPDSYIVFDETREALRRLRLVPYRHCVLSNNFPELEALMEKLGIRKEVDMVLTSAQLGWEKPNPEIFKAAIKKTGAGPGSWMVGDNAIADYGGAENAGLRAVLVHNIHPMVERKAESLIEAANFIEMTS